MRLLCFGYVRHGGARLGLSAATRRRRALTSARALLAALSLSSLAVSFNLHAQSRELAGSFAATTGSMTPSGRALEVEVLEWSDRERRAAVVTALQSGADIGETLGALSSHGYLWVDGSSIGYAVKYAHRSSDGERITLVIDRPLGHYGYESWTVGETTVSEGVEYAVLSLNLEAGTGTFTPVVEPAFDAGNALVTLEPEGGADDAPLVDVARQPEPYWTRDE